MSRLDFKPDPDNDRLIRSKKLYEMSAEELDQVKLHIMSGIAKGQNELLKDGFAQARIIFTNVNDDIDRLLSGEWPFAQDP